VVFDGSRPLTSGTTVAHPLQVGARDAGRPEAEFDLMQQMLPYLLLLGFIGGMQVAIDATADERGRQSLDPLLATPAPREAIISATILATVVFAPASLAVTLVAYRVSFDLMPDDRVDVSFAIGPAAMARLLVVILPIVLLGATALTALAAFARSYREAQGYLPLLVLRPMLPSLVLMIAPVRTQLWMLAVPFLAQNQLILKILRSEHIGVAEWAVSLGAGLLIVALAWLVAARLYHREQLAASS